MRSRQSKSVDRFLSTAMLIRRGILRGKHAIEAKRRQNSKTFVLGKGTANRFGLSTKIMSSTTVLTMGSGNNCILYLHGGTYVDPPTVLHYNMLRRISQRSGWKVVLPIYSRAPIGTAETVVPNMYDIYSQLKCDPSIDKLVVMGDSAGGGLALAMCQYILSKGGVQPDKIVLICPWLDVTMTNPDISRQIAKDKMLTVPTLVTYGNCYANNCNPVWLANPIHNITKGLAPIELFVGSSEVFLPDCLLAKTLADKAGADMKLYEFANMQHVFPLLPIPECIEPQNMIIQMLEDMS